MNQYFSVGEEVILCSVINSECNGEYKILDFRDNKDAGVKDTVTGEIRFTHSYKLDVSANGTSWWNQRVLRKKHKPSEFKSLSELINSTKEVKA